VRADGASVIRLIRRHKGEASILAEKPVPAGRVYLKAEAQGQACSFSISPDGSRWEFVTAGVDGRILSTTVAGGFVAA